MNSTMNVKYSVAIRTLGTAGEKYIKLLKSIDAQTIKPEKVIVVLPEGYSGAYIRLRRICSFAKRNDNSKIICTQLYRFRICPLFR